MMEIIQPSMEMNTELVCVMASIGYADGEDYFKGVDCLESLKDMIRFLRHEDLKICNIRRQMGHAKVLQNDLLPLLVSCAEEKELVDIVLRLLVNLTSAPELCFDKNEDDEAKNDREKKTFEIQMISYLQAYKEAFAEKTAMSAIGSHLGRILQLEKTEREEEDVLLLERILLLIRNLLFIPSNPEEEKRTDDDVTIHDQLLWNLHVNGIDDLLIYLSSSDNESNWCMHALEILSHMFREQNAEELARTDENRSRKEKEEDTKKIATILAEEKAEKERKFESRGARHSRFGGSFWIKGRKALKEDEDLVYHRTLQSTKNLTHDFDKNPEKKRKTKKPLKEVNKERRSTLSVRIFLKEFCMKFLEHSYNNLMYVVKRNLSSGRTQKHDETYYISVMRFFMAFNRVRSFRVEYISQTFGIEAFSYIQSLILRYLETYSISKVSKDREAKMEYARRLKLAVSAYKELLMYIAIMMKGNDENLRKAASVIQNNIFYTEEYRSLFIGILRAWNVVFQTKTFLKDVVEAFHLYLKLFEEFLKDKGTFLTKTKGISRRVKKKPTARKQRCPIEITGQQAEDLWQNTVSVNLSACIQGREGGIPDDVILPFDPTSDVPVDDQVTMAFATIQRLLRCDQTGKAIAYLRVSRDCWLEERRFGTANMSIEEEFMCLREIFFMEVPLEALQQADATLRDNELQEEDVLEEEEEEIVSTQVQSKEKKFDIKPFIKQLGNTKIVTPYCYLLKSYKENSSHTNHCIIKMLHRVAVDLKLHAMLFQLSVFISFKSILNEPKIPEYKEMKGFAKFILAKFFDIYKEKPNIVVSVLFWKSNIECYEITEGEDFAARKSNKSKIEAVGKWTFEQEQELIDLYDQLKNEEDVIEKILEKIQGQNRTAHQITNKLTRLRILEKPKKRKPNEWTEEETAQLTRVFEEFKDSDDPLGNIMNGLSLNKGKKWVIAHLLEIGLVNDRRELHKKRKKKSKVGGAVDEDDNEDNDLLIDEDEENYRDEAPETEPNRSDSENEDSAEDVYDDNDLSPNATLSQIVQRLTELDFCSQVEWVQGRLRRLANEREHSEGAEEWQSVPLVPIIEDHENALESKLFQRMLKRVGVNPPASEQESFWRISSTLTPAELKSFAEDLEKPAATRTTTKRPRSQGGVHGEGSTRNAEIREKEAEAANDNDESDDDDFFERFISGNKKPTIATLSNLNRGNEDDEDESGNIENNENGNNEQEIDEQENNEMKNDEDGSKENENNDKNEDEIDENENIDKNEDEIDENENNDKNEDAIDENENNDKNEDEIVENENNDKNEDEIDENENIDKNEDETDERKNNENNTMNGGMYDRDLHSAENDSLPLENGLNTVVTENEKGGEQDEIGMNDSGNNPCKERSSRFQEVATNGLSEDVHSSRFEADNNASPTSVPSRHVTGSESPDPSSDVTGREMENGFDLNEEKAKKKIPLKRGRESAFYDSDDPDENGAIDYKEDLINERQQGRKEKKRKIVDGADEEEDNMSQGAEESFSLEMSIDDRDN